ncbi:hypothetical protein AB0F03_32990 [Streptomyces sp. NPDC028722]|uniref:hypothetical protein n=1 Tax=Streptomyces sp. NPDC028722 TaxID=3155016 RepID=UPI0033E35EE1
MVIGVALTAASTAPSAAAIDTSGAAIRRAITHVQGADSPQCRYREPQGQLYGVQTVSMTAQRKRALIRAGATSRHIAIAMLENEKMDTSYPLYDNKSGDAANFGVFKQNWGVIRSTSPRYHRLKAADYARGRELNSNVSLDVTVLKQSIQRYGLKRWMAAHRCGATGLTNPNLRAVKQYIGAVDILTEKIAASDRQFGPNDYRNLKRSNKRFWINVPAV